jgi:hypothetical protein
MAKGNTDQKQNNPVCPLNGRVSGRKQHQLQIKCAASGMVVNECGSEVNQPETTWKI